MKEKKKILEEFKEFAVKGNAVDLAVGIVIGAAFTGIVNSFVKDVINPLIGLLTGGIDFSDKTTILKAATDTAEAVTLNYGVFINAILNFLIVAWAIFFVVRFMNNLNKKQEKCPEEEKPAAPPRDIQLLEEIRDELRNNKN